MFGDSAGLAPRPLPACAQDAQLAADPRAALELPQPLRLQEALEVCLVYRDAAPQRYDQAAVRWIARYCAERPQLTLGHVDAAVAAFQQLRSDPEGALERLQALAAP